MASLKQEERDTATALRLLLLAPEAAPRLVLTEAQAAVLRPLLGESEEDTRRLLVPWRGQSSSPARASSASGDAGAAAWVEEEEEPCADGEKGQLGGSLLRPRRLRVNTRTWLSLRSLDAATEGALLDQAHAGGSPRLFVLHLTQPVMHALLATCGNAGVRQEVRASVGGGGAARCGEANPTHVPSGHPRFKQLAEEADKNKR